MKFDFEKMVQMENWNDEVHFSGIQKWCYYADLLNAEVRK